MKWGLSPRARLLNGTAVALVVAFTGSAYAQDAQQAGGTVLDTITVDGQAQTGTSATAPQTQTTDRAVVQQKMVTDYKDFARRIDAGVNFDSASGSVNLRGLQDNRVLTTIDGIRLPWLTDPRESAVGGGDAFDFDSLSSVDITKGADSSRYGSGALGGVVELRTLNPEDLIEDGKNFGALTKTTYDSANDSTGGNAAAAARSGDTWFMVQGGYTKGHETETSGDVGGYNSTRTEANPGDFVQKNLLVKFHQYLEGGHRIGLTGEIFNRDEDFDNMRGTTATNYEEGTLKGGEETDRKRISASYDYVAPDNSSIVDTASLIAYWQKERINNTTSGIRLPDARGFIIPGDPFFYGYPSGAYSRDNMIEQTSYGITGNAAKQVDIGGVSNEFRFGGEFVWQQTHQYSAGEDNCPDVDWTTIPQFFGPQTCRMLHSNASDMPDVDSYIFGLYVEDDIKLMDDRLTVTPGLRFDWYSHNPKSTSAYEDNPNYDPAFLESTDDMGLSPKLRLAYQVTPELEVFAQYARGFRAPTAQELYQNFGAPGSYARIGNPDLDTETSNGFEIGAKYDGGDYRIGATVFNNYYKNFIDTVMLAPPGGEYPVGGVTGYENLNNVQIYGVEIAGEWVFQPNWRTWGSFAWTYGEDRDTGAYLDSIAPMRAIVGLGYFTETWGTDVSVTMASERDKVTDGFVAPGYGVVDATIWWTPERIADVDVSGLRVQAGVFNLFDKKYWDALSVPDGTTTASADYFSEPGRTFKVSISKTF
ncbi:TonB-dependent hemoglobin/transferrin/lactoferrin family receptor [Ciceribacter sp. L1K23]|uniref:TonB-dependent hemoglobin/transferrin/lactoferrin family receptor n=1 Tax=Ciceribacter sp. L1K23 TaxID=2820276 RepID=UPI001B8223C4|nr:TonB-dependent hemoglobin/transferrin/lactoferrin family receptor [Ciceribacter sp. L1K23]MBR0554637.1 TonB-dependent hemoglobin/transferrin/lactoferrin family receptor [Ciceribacter sp. L1K23]